MKSNRAPGLHVSPAVKPPAHFGMVHRARATHFHLWVTIFTHRGLGRFLWLLRPSLAAMQDSSEIVGALHCSRAPRGLTKCAISSDQASGT